MDTDDIAVEDRFEQQFELMEKKTWNLSRWLSHAEFIDQPDEIVSTVVRRLHEISLPTNVWSAFNHMTVMFKKKDGSKGWQLRRRSYMEDDLLGSIWLVQELELGMDQILWAASGAGMFERRGGLRYSKLYRQARKRMHERGQISYGEYLKSVLVQVVAALAQVYTTVYF